MILLLLTSCDPPRGDETASTPTTTDVRQHAVTSANVDSFPFVNVAERAGLDLDLTSGRTPATQIVEVKGGGLALIDHDADGDWDIFVPNGATLDAPGRGPGCRLFENVTPGSDGDLAFVDTTNAARLSFDRWGMGVAVGDANGDGFDDLYVTAFGENALLINDGEGGFDDRTSAAGVGDRRWGTGCAFGDIDLDGDLDLYVVNYLAFDIDDPPPGDSFKGVPVFGGPAGLRPQADVLYANRGDGTYLDVTAVSGCADVQTAHGLNVVIIDIDRDGRQEILVGNDSMPNRLFDDDPESAGPVDPTGAGHWARRLVDRGLASGLSANAEGHDQATMGFAISDVDDNGLPDVYSTNFSSDTNTLHLNVDGRFFDDRTARFGLALHTRMRVGWAAGFHDLDSDGDEDLLVFNGHVYSQATEVGMDSPARQAPLLFEREGETFRVVQGSPGSWLTKRAVDRSAAFGDLDGDGDIDIVVGERNGPLRLLRNDTQPRPDAWIAVRLDDRRSDAANPRGLGAEVSLSWDGGTARRWIISGGSYLSASEPVARFGLPDAARNGGIRVVVVWPDGFVQSLEGVTSGELVVERR